MAPSTSIKLKNGQSAQDCIQGDAKKYFNVKGDDEKGELTLKEDGSVKIAYQVQGETCIFTVTQSPKLFNDGDWKGMLNEMFG